jgi:hypothetical protein
MSAARVVGGRIVEGWAAHCSALSAARSRAATMQTLHDLPPLVGTDDESDSASDHGHLMASVRTR